MSAFSSHKVHPLWRGIAGITAIAIGAFELVGHQVARSINLAYFNTPSASISGLDVVAICTGAYLLVLAISGRWRPHWKGA